VHVAGTRKGLWRKKELVGKVAEAPKVVNGGGCEGNVSGVNVGDVWLGG